MNGKLIDNKVIEVKRYSPKEERIVQMKNEEKSFTNLYVTNLPSCTTEKLLRETFKVKSKSV